MKTAFRTPGGEIVIKESFLPPVKAQDVKIKITACGICGTDIHAKPAREEGFGHEIVGIVTETGSAVTHVKTGDIVAVDSATPCGHCDHCRNCRPDLCTDIQSFFYYGFFGFAEELLVPGICAFHYHPAKLTPAQASLHEPLGVALDMTKLADIKPGMNVLVIGAGPIGLMAQALAKQHGAGKIFVSDFKQFSFRYQAAQAIGCDGWIDPAKEALTDYRFGCDIERILVTAPPALLPAAIKIAAPTAIISYIGIGWDKADITFNADDFHFKKLQLRASFASPAHFGAEAIRLLEERVIDPDWIISHTYQFADLARALETAKSAAAGKVVITY